MESKVLMDAKDVQKVTGYKRNKAFELMKLANAYTKKQGYILPRRGCCYVKAFAKITGLTKDEILEAKGGNTSE
jgi:hypothetical protein